MTDITGAVYMWNFHKFSIYVYDELELWDSILTMPSDSLLSSYYKNLLLQENSTYEHAVEYKQKMIR